MVDDSSGPLDNAMYEATDRPANYLPDELLLEILEYIPRDAAHQGTLATFCAVNRQFYDVGIPELYAAPHLTGAAYALFLRTICPSIIPRIKKSQLAGLVRCLDLSTIVHQGAKSTTARLLGRTKSSLEIFVAPQASFAINCWASLTKCSRLRKLDLSLVSEAISYESLNRALKQLSELRELYMPRCSTHFDKNVLSRRVVWPPRLEYLSLSGTVHGKFLWEMTRQPDTFPPQLHSISISHCPGLDSPDIKKLLLTLSNTLTTVALRDLPSVKQGRFDGILDLLPHLTHFTVAIEYISEGFGRRPVEFSPERWREAKPLTSLTLVTSGGHDVDPDFVFAIPDLYDLLDRRFLGRMRYVNVATSTGWDSYNEGDQFQALRELLVDDLDKENWENRRWHYEGLGAVPKDMDYFAWKAKTALGRKMRPMLSTFSE